MGREAFLHSEENGNRVAATEHFSRSDRPHERALLGNRKRQACLTNFISKDVDATAKAPCTPEKANIGFQDLIPIPHTSHRIGVQAETGLIGEHNGRPLIQTPISMLSAPCKTDYRVRRHDSLRRRAVGRLEACQSQAEVARWWSPGYGIISKKVVLSPGRSVKVAEHRHLNRIATWLDDIGGQRLLSFFVTFLQCLKEFPSKQLTAVLQRLVFKLSVQSVMRRNAADKVILVESSPGEKMCGSHFHPSCITKIDRFGRSGIIVIGGIMLGSRTPL
ncbi:hypothetical protein TNCV_3676141 [Trichonephila clavipes]|nr:hypothetical protein TNCV_3676141 [Trichonephila clavipes]